MQKVASLVTGLGTVALLASPSSAAVAPVAPSTALIPTGVDPVIIRAATSVAQPAAPEVKVQGSGTDNQAVKCLVKFFEPEELKSREPKAPYGAYGGYSKDNDPVFLFQSKLICTDTVGVSEILIEQNDQLVVAGTVTNNQTDVTLHNLTLKLNEEQEDQFCLAIARQTASGGSFAVVAQECFFNLGRDHAPMYPSAPPKMNSGKGGSK